MIRKVVNFWLAGFQVCAIPSKCSSACPSQWQTNRNGWKPCIPSQFNQGGLTNHYYQQPTRRAKICHNTTSLTPSYDQNITTTTVAIANTLMLCNTAQRRILLWLSLGEIRLGQMQLSVRHSRMNGRANGRWHWRWQASGAVQPIRSVLVWQTVGTAGR